MSDQERRSGAGGANQPSVEDRPSVEEPPSVEDFLGEPTRSLRHWRWLWSGDIRFPVRSHRGIMGWPIVLFKRLLRPFVQVPQNDLWERQRVFNLVLLERLQSLVERTEDLDTRARFLEAFARESPQEIMRYTDALWTRLDQKVDAFRTEARDQQEALQSALALLEQSPTAEQHEGSTGHVGRRLEEAVSETAYRAFEDRYRGTREDIRARIEHYLPRLEGRSPILDLGCGRGEALSVLKDHQLEARGVDSSHEMVRQCQRLGLRADRLSVLEALSTAEPGSLGAVVSFHVIEHLEPEQIDRLIVLALRALRPGGVLILETPNPLSLCVGGSSFWLDPTHRRPVHPEFLRSAASAAGFESVELLPLHPYSPAERLPEVDLAGLDESERQLGDRVNRLRDRLDDLLYGSQDIALVAERRER